MKSLWQTLERLLCRPLYSKEIKVCQVLLNWRSWLALFAIFKVLLYRNICPKDLSIKTIVTYLRGVGILCQRECGLDPLAHGSHRKEWRCASSLTWAASHLGGAQAILGGLTSFHRSVSAVFLALLVLGLSLLIGIEFVSFCWSPLFALHSG